MSEFADQLQDVINFIEDMKKIMNERGGAEVDTETVIDTLIALDGKLAEYNMEVAGE